MRVRIACFAALMCVAPTLSADARPHTFRAAGVQIDVPASWRIESRTSSIRIAPASGAAAISVGVVRGISVSKAYQVLRVQVEMMLARARIGGRHRVTVNGMRGLASTARGKTLHGHADVGLAVLPTPNKSVLLVLAIGYKGRHAKEIRQVTSSIGPIRSAAMASPDEVGKAFVRALARRDRTSLESMIASRVRYHKKQIGRASLIRIILGGRFPLARACKQMNGAVTVQKNRGKNMFWIFCGSGYGLTSVGVFRKSSQGWTLREVEQIDYGAP